MARFPAVSSAGAAVPASIFSRLREHLATFTGDVIPLQIGDASAAPPVRLEDVAWGELAPAELYAYGAPAGWAPLLDALVTKVQTTNRIAVAAGGLQISVGATHALSCAVQALCDPGDELLLLTPHWPLIRGIALASNVVPVGVPVAADATPDELVEAITAAITPRTTALYFGTPNNPDGAIRSADALAAIAEVAAHHGLWILADEVYELYGYDAAHVSIGSLPAGVDRTVTVFSFAKSYAQAGLRVGYAVGPAPVLATVRKILNHSVYNVPVAMQRAALGALEAGGPFVAETRARYRQARDGARARLRAPSASPAGGAYLWVDFRRWTGDDCMPILERCAAAGVLLAPGAAFGTRGLGGDAAAAAAVGGFARLCFTGVSQDRLDAGVDRINAVLERS